jgi:glutaconate CoA-transferase, subunit B
VNATDCTADERMIVTAARQLRDGAVCFVGIGLPSAACNLARLTHAPNIVLIYESGTVGTHPSVLPLSIGDGELAETADAVVPLPEIFAHYLQRGRVDVGFLGAAQIDRRGRLNSTVIGAYARPKVRLPGAGGAPDIATHARDVFVVMKQTARTFVERLDFRTSCPRVSAVITDFGVLRPSAADGELELAAVYPGVSIDEARAATGWPLRMADRIETLAPPDEATLACLRDLQARTRAAHDAPVRIPSRN